MLSVNCVIVTYNRLSLLKECIAAVQAQSCPVKKVIVINNASTDGTEEYLSTLPKDIFAVFNLEKNTGGAGGFNKGLKESYKAGADWTWLMDDDTIPRADSLETLVRRTSVDDNFGFLSSIVLFTDGTPHIMNNHLPDNMHGYQYNSFLKDNLLLTGCSAFVSCLISHNAVKTVGLPITDFFIWSDDIEYTQRIIKAGFFGGIVLDSFVTHKTKTNYSSSIINATPDIFWRFKFDRRNQIYLLKKRYPFGMFTYQYLKNIIKNCRSCLKRKDYKIKMLGIVFRSSISGLFFNPKIEKV